MFRRSLALCFLFLPGVAAAAGPTGRLYFTDPDSGLLGTLQGNVETYTASPVTNEGPIAVFGAVATAGIVPGGFGASYDLDGTYTGNLFTNPLSEAAYDGTTDGASNYLLDVGGTVYQTGLDFVGATSLFSAGSGANGIAFDPTRNALWITTGGFLTAFSLTGDVLSTFALSTGDSGAVAFDPLDGTVWVAGSVLTQYASDGTALQSYALATGASIAGMEFDLKPAPVPEPASLVAVGLGLLASRRRRATAQVK